MLKTHYMLTKPGIIFGNSITAAAGFVLASKGTLDFWLFLAMLIGLSFVIASACVFNNCIDRHADQKMARTKHRALATGSITLSSAVLFGIFLGLCGTLILALFTNLLTVVIALAGVFGYVVLYSIWKYRSTFGTVIGSISGAVPPVVGYCAVSNSFDLGALLLFVIVVLWQMPHFYAIAIYRFEDYKAASIPVLPVVKGVAATKVHMLLYTIAFVLALPLLTFFGYAGYLYLIVSVVLSLAWLLACIKGFKTHNNHRWAREFFRLSLVVITGICIAILVDRLLLSAAFTS